MGGRILATGGGTKADFRLARLSIGLEYSLLSAFSLLEVSYVWLAQALPMALLEFDWDICDAAIF